MKIPALLCLCLSLVASAAKASWSFDGRPASRHAAGSYGRLGRWAKYAAGVGAVGAVGWGVQRARMRPAPASRNATSVEERLEALEEDVDNIREVVRRVYRSHTEEIARVRMELEKMQANESAPSDQFGPLNERINVLDSSLRAMKSQLEDSMIEVEGRTENSMQRVQTQIKSEQDALHKEVHEIRSLVPEMQARINDELMEKLKAHSDELLAAVQKQFES